MKTIQQVSREILDNMEYSKRDNDSKYCHLKEDIQWQQDIIRAVHLDRFPNDDIYDRINTILHLFVDAEIDSDLGDLLYEIEPDIYTNDLTKWLNNHIENVFYLDEALKECEHNDSFKLLAMAQHCYIVDIGQALLTAIDKYIEA